MMKVAILKKMLGIMLGVMLVLTASVSAMTFSQPVKLGEIFNTPSGGFIFKGVTSNNGKSYINERWSKNEKLYEKGVAIFGSGNDALYVHYDDNKKINIMFGNVDGINTFALDHHMIEESCEVKRIDSDNKLVLYVLKRFSGSMGSENWIILGKTPNGLFVKYFETKDIRKQYFSNPRYVDFNRIYTQGNTIIISYKYFYPKNEHNGEFHFKWDEAAQWFGVEQVVY